MNYRLLLLPAMGIATAACLAGCSGRKNEGVKTESELEPRTTITAALHPQDESETGESPAHGRYKPGEEIKDASALLPAFQMGSMTAYLGETTVAELAEEGACLEPAGAVSSLDFEEPAGNERSIVLSFEESPFTVKVRNTSAQAQAIKNSVITEIYADQGALFSIGGLMIGDTADDLTNVLGEPYAIVDGGELAGSYGNLSAYYYASRWDDRNIIFFVENMDDVIVSFKEKMPQNFITDVEQITGRMFSDLIQEREKTAGDSVMKTPRLADVENSEYAESELSDIKYISAKLYTLNEIKEPETFNKDIDSIDAFVPDSVLVIEYKASVRYRKDELDHLEFLGQTLEPSYKVIGAFYILNPFINEDGKIDSNVGENRIRNMDGVYVTYDALYEDLFGEEKQGYSFTDYSVTEHSLT